MPITCILPIQMYFFYPVASIETIGLRWCICGTKCVCHWRCVTSWRVVGKFIVYCCMDKRIRIKTCISTYLSSHHTSHHRSHSAASHYIHPSSLLQHTSSSLHLSSLLVVHGVISPPSNQQTMLLRVSPLFFPSFFLLI